MDFLGGFAAFKINKETTQTAGTCSHGTPKTTDQSSVSHPWAGPKKRAEAGETPAKDGPDSMSLRYRSCRFYGHDPRVMIGKHIRVSDKVRADWDRAVSPSSVDGYRCTSCTPEFHVHALVRVDGRQQTWVGSSHSGNPRVQDQSVSDEDPLHGEDAKKGSPDSRGRRVTSLKDRGIGNMGMMKTRMRMALQPSGMSVSRGMRPCPFPSSGT
jgi:hypothetical protein